jgi:hypothetical protein
LLVTLLSAWMASVILPFGLPDRWRFLLPIGVVAAAGMVLVPVLLLRGAARRVKRLPGDWPAASRQVSIWLLLPVLVSLAVTIVAFGGYLVGLGGQSEEPQRFILTLGRVVGGGVVSPAPAALCLFAALYTGMFAAMRRASLVGFGYTALEEKSVAFALFNRLAGANARVDARPSPRARLGDVLDMPAQNLPMTYVVVVLLAVVIAAFGIRKVSTIDGAAFTWFLSAGSATVLVLGLLNLAQGLAIWNTARVHLKWLALAPLDSAFRSIAPLVPWDLSLAPPRLMELMPLARRADDVGAELLAMGGPAQRREVEVRFGLEPRALDKLWKRVRHLSKARMLEREIRECQQAAFIQSSSWFRLWKVSDAIVDLLQRNVWSRTAEGRPESHLPSGLPVVLSVSSLPEARPAEAVMSPMVKLAAVLEAKPAAPPEPLLERGTLIKHCEEFVALQFVLVLRDILARTLSALFTAMLCLSFLTAAHLLYSFNGRSAMLTVDLLTVAAASLASIWILVGMERETVLSRLRNTTSGRVDFNWAFLQRIAIYGVLPLLAVISSLFPEIGNSLFGWLEPLKKLTSF